MIGYLIRMPPGHLLGEVDTSQHRAEIRCWMAASAENWRGCHGESDLGISASTAGRQSQSEAENH